MYDFLKRKKSYSCLLNIVFYSYLSYSPDLRTLVISFFGSFLAHNIISEFHGFWSYWNYSLNVELELVGFPSSLHVSVTWLGFLVVLM